MPRPQYDDYLGCFEHPSQLYDIGPPEQVAFYSCFINDSNDYRFNEHSALRRFKGLRELHLPLQLESAVDREEFQAISARLEKVPRPSLVPVIAACVGSRGAALVRDADIISRRGALSSLGTGEEMTFSVVYVKGKLHIERKDFVSNLDVVHDGPYFGHCFEEACTIPETTESNGRFCSIVSRKLGDLNIVMAGEVDCAEGGYPNLESYRELKTQRFKKHKNWPKWYLQSYLLGVPTLILGNRSKRNLITGIQTMSMETLLATTMMHSPGFDPALALGRIHNILSALIQHCKTRAAYLYTGCFSCELHIRPQGNAFVPPVPPNYETKAELLRMWELVREVDGPDEALIPRSLRPAVSEPDSQLTKNTESFVPPVAIQPVEPIPPILSRAIIAPFVLFCTLRICYGVFRVVFPVVTLIFQIMFSLLFSAFALLFSVIFCMIVLAPR